MFYSALALVQNISGINPIQITSSEVCCYFILYHALNTQKIVSWLSRKNAAKDLKDSIGFKDAFVLTPSILNSIVLLRDKSNIFKKALQPFQVTFKRSSRNIVCVCVCVFLK